MCILLLHLYHGMCLRFPLMVSCHSLSSVKQPPYLVKAAKLSNMRFSTTQWLPIRLTVCFQKTILHSVEMIVQAWSDNRDPNEAIDIVRLPLDLLLLC